MFENNLRCMVKKKYVKNGPFIGAFLFICLFLPSCSKMTDLEHIDRAKEFVAKGDYRAAIIEYKNALSLNSENAEVRFYLGEVYARTGDIEGAKKELLIAYEKGYHQDEVKATLAKVLVSGQKFDEVIERISVSPAKDKKITAKIYTYLGLAYVGLGDEARGAELIDEAMSLNVQSPDASYGKAYLDFLNKRYDKAVLFLDDAIKLAPFFPDARLLLADISFIQREYAKSQDEYLYVVEHEPNNILTLYALRANLGLIQSLIAQNKFDAAKVRVNAILAKAPANPLLLYFSGMIAYQEKDYGGAEEKLLKVLALTPNHMPSLFLLGAINLQQNELEQAGEYLGIYLARDSSNVQARKILAATRMRLRQPELAMAALEPVLDQVGENASLLSLAGSIALRSGKLDVGTSYLEKASIAQPDNTSVRTELALAYLANSDFSQAIKELEVASRLESVSGGKKAGLMLVLTHLKSGDGDVALKEARKFLSHHPKDPTAYNLLGIVYGQTGKGSAARKSFKDALALNPQYTPAVVNLARMAQAQGNLRDARQLYESILSYDAKNLSVIMALAYLDQRLGNIDASVSWLIEATIVSPDSLLPRVMLAHHYLRILDIPNAQKYIEEVNDISPSSSDALALSGLLAKVEGRLDQALKLFIKLLAIEPDSLLGLYQSALIYSAKGEYALAERSLKKVLANNRDHVPSVSLLARIQMKKGNLSKAQVLVDRVKSKKGDSYGAYVLEADLFFEQRRYSDAIALYQKTLALRPGDALVLKIAKSYRLEGNSDAAKRTLDEWLKKEPNSYRVRLVLAGEQQLRGEYDKAIKTYEALLSLRADDPLVLNNLAWLYSEKENDKAKAREFAEKAYALKPRDPFILDTLGWILVDKGELERGAQLLRKAEKLAPNVADIKYHLAVVLAKLGENEQAKSLLKLLLKSPGGLGVDAVEVKGLLDSL